MCRVETSSNRGVSEAVENVGDFLEARAYRSAHARRVFDQDAQIAQWIAAAGLLHGLDNVGDGLGHGALAARAGVNDQKIRAEGYAAD